MPEPEPDPIFSAEDGLEELWDRAYQGEILGELLFGPITAQFIPLYRRIGELSPSERETAGLLVAHEEALRDFSRAEIAGDRAHSLDPIMALAHMR